MAETNPIPPSLTTQAIINFWNKVERGQPSECWPWKAAKFTGGYGQHKVGGRTVKSHRVAYFVFYGTWPIKPVLHNCDHPPCCNPLHLRAGTNKENSEDCKAKGRLNTASGVRHGSFTHPERWARGERQGMSKLSADQVKDIRRLYAQGNISQHELGKRFNVCRENIGAIVRAEHWCHIAKEDGRGTLSVAQRRAIKGEKNHFAKLNESQVREIREWHASGGITQAELASHFHVNSQSIYNIVHRKSWTHI